MFIAIGSAMAALGIGFTVYSTIDASLTCNILGGIPFITPNPVIPPANPNATNSTLPNNIIGVFATKNLSLDQATNTLIQSTLSHNNSLIVFRTTDGASIMNGYENQLYTDMQATSIPTIETAISTELTWPIKTKFINYDPELGFSPPANETGAGVPNAVHIASQKIHNAGYKMSWSPQGFGFFTRPPYYQLINDWHDVDLLIWQVQGCRTYNLEIPAGNPPPCRYYPEQAVNYIHATSPTFVLHISPNNAASGGGGLDTGLQFHSQIAAFKLPIGATSKFTSSNAASVATTSDSQTCTNSTNIVTLSTTFNGGNTLIFAPVQLKSLDNTNKFGTIELFKNGVKVQQDQYKIPMVGANTIQDALFYVDSATGVSPQYSVKGCTDAGSIGMASKVLGINGITNFAFSNGTSVSLTAGISNVVTTMTTTLPAASNYVIANVEIANGVNAQIINPSSIKILNNANQSLTVNYLPINLTSLASQAQSKFYLQLIGYDTSAILNPTYRVVINNLSQAGAIGVAEMIAFPAGPNPFYVDSDTISANAKPTEMARVTTNFPANTTYAMITASQFKDNNAGTDVINASAPAGSEPPYLGALTLDESYTSVLTSNLYQINPSKQGGLAGDGFSYMFVWTNKTTTHNPNTIVMPQLSLTLNTPSELTAQFNTIKNLTNAFTLVYGNSVAGKGSTPSNFVCVMQLYQGNVTSC